jgi:hypothetical protein
MRSNWQQRASSGSNLWGMLKHQASNHKQIPIRNALRIETPTTSRGRCFAGGLSTFGTFAIGDWNLFGACDL